MKGEIHTPHGDRPLIPGRCSAVVTSRAGRMTTRKQCKHSAKLYEPRWVMFGAPDPALYGWCNQHAPSKIDEREEKFRRDHAERSAWKDQQIHRATKRKEIADAVIALDFGGRAQLPPHILALVRELEAI